MAFPLIPLAIVLAAILTVWGVTAARIRFERQAPGSGFDPGKALTDAAASAGKAAGDAAAAALKGVAEGLGDGALGPILLIGGMVVVISIATGKR